MVDCEFSVIQLAMATVGRAKYTHPHARNFEETLASRLLEISRVRVCISATQHSPSPKLETTRSLEVWQCSGHRVEHLIGRSARWKEQWFETSSLHCIGLFS